MPATETSRPLRTCVGCRERAVQSELIRMVLVHDELIVDERRVQGGRGVYLHPRASCGDAAVTRRAFSKAFRRAVAISTLPSDWHRLLSTDSPSRDTGA